MAKYQENDLPKAKITKASVQQFISLFKYVKPYRLQFFGGLLFLLLSSFTSLVFPFAIGELIDTALKSAGKGSFENINILAGGLLGVLLVQALFSFLRIIWFVEVAEKSAAALRKDLYARIILLPMNFFGQRRVGELASRISTDIVQIQDTFTNTLAESIRGVINLLLGIGVIIFISLKLTLFMLATFPVFVIAAIFFGKYIRKISKEASDKLADAGVVVEESLQSIQSVKAFTNEKYEMNRYATVIDNVVGITMKGAKLRGAFASFIIFALFGAIIAVMWYGAGMVQEGQITIGELTSFLIYTMFVGGAVGSFGEQYSQIQKTLGATERVRELLLEETEPIHIQPTIIKNKRLQGAISFKNVSFHYPSRPEMEVIQQIDFDIQPGEKIALVGASGAGKSTIISLLLQFYKPTQGSIFFDNQQTDTYDLSYLRSQLAIVPQDVLLFGGTIYENIAYGRLNATSDEVQTAAKQANAHEFISSFPDTYQTIVGERGIKLSGGQRQRIAIARAVLRNPAILLLDEATSSLDSESERLVQEALEELMQNRTSIIIAHRLATIRNADKIIVLQQNKIVEIGTHTELIEKENGVYSMLATMQFTH